MFGFLGIQIRNVSAEADNLGLQPRVQFEIYASSDCSKYGWSDDGRAVTSHEYRAVAAKDLNQSCWSQLRLMLAVAEFSGPQSAVPIFTQVRTDVLKLGDPHVSAALHLFLGEVDAKRGMLKSAERHAALGQQLLGDEPNLWLQAYAENLLVCITVMRSDPVEGFERAR